MAFWLILLSSYLQVFSKELLGIHTGPLALSVSSRKEQVAPGFEYNEINACIVMPNIVSGM